MSYCSSTTPKIYASLPLPLSALDSLISRTRSVRVSIWNFDAKVRVRVLADVLKHIYIYISENLLYICVIHRKMSI